MSEQPIEEVHAELWETVMEALIQQSRGLPVDEEKVEEATTILAAAQLVRSGLPIDTVEHLFCERDHTIHLAYDRETDEISLSFDWGNDGDACWRCDSATATTEVGLCDECREGLVSDPIGGAS